MTDVNDQSRRSLGDYLAPNHGKSLAPAAVPVKADNQVSAFPIGRTQPRPLVSPSRPVLAANADTMRTFFEAIFSRRRTGGWLALRAFDHGPHGFPVGRDWIELSESSLTKIADEATRIANMRTPAAFCPPLCSFLGHPDKHGRRRTREADVLFAPVLSVELDEHPIEGSKLLADTLGPPTVTVKSGGRWTTPDGRQEAKLHLHWRLARPAENPEQFDLLKRARRMAAVLVGGDRTAIPFVHPMRWPGSWHTKDPDSPRLCELASVTTTELQLQDAISRLDFHLSVLGLDVDPIRSAGSRDGFITPTALSSGELNALASAIPNTDELAWSEWNTTGMAFYDAAHGSDAGREAFQAWSSKNGTKYDSDLTDARWDHISEHPPSELGAGSLIFKAQAALPGFLLPSTRPVASSAEWFDGDASRHPETASPGLPEHIRRLNRAHAFVMNGGSAVVANEGANGTVTFSPRQTFFDRYANDLVQNGSRKISIAEAWWSHPGRRQFLGGVDFMPEGAPADIYNLWRGFPLTPDPNHSCKLFLAHLRENVCSGNDAYYVWFLGWLAQIVQRPGEKLDTAVVLRGDQGVGKTVVGEYFRLILGPRHHVFVSQAEHLTGRFNSHLQTALLVQVEEGFWAGDKAAAAALKDLVSNPQMRIERKGVDVIGVRNNLRLLVTTNSRWAVPAGLAERRFAIFDVSDAHRQDHAYFGAIHRELQDGGAAGLLHALLAFDLGSVDLRTIPETTGLLEQKIESFEPHQQWWFETLKRGTVGVHTDGWPQEVSRQELISDYERFAAKMRARSLNHQALGRELRALCPGIGDRRPRSGDGVRRQRFYTFPDLPHCRADFERAVHARVDWEDA